MNRAQTKLVLIGNGAYTQVAESLLHAADDLDGVDVTLVDTRISTSASRILNAVAWRFADRRPPFGYRMAGRIVAAVADAASSVVLSTGNSLVEASTLRTCRALGAVSLHLSTDDPWNPGQGSRWLRAALPEYDVVFTPRTSNLSDFKTLGCRDVRYLPFGYDERLLAQLPGHDAAGHDVLFVGGADPDRLEFFLAFFRAQGEAALVGGYWNQHAQTRTRWLGHRPVQDVVALTAAAKVNLILVRRANRDGHVMRSFEAGAIGGCLAVEDTPEHREIFGAEGEAVRYFRSPEEAAGVCQSLIADPLERSRLTTAVRRRILGGQHSYRDRLLAVLNAAAEVAGPTRTMT